LDSQLAEDAGFLRQVAHAEAGPLEHRQLANILTIEVHEPGIGSDLPGGHAEAGCLAGSVWSQQTDHFAQVDVVVHPVYHLAPAVVLYQPAHLQDGHRPSSLIRDLPPTRY